MKDDYLVRHGYLLRYDHVKHIPATWPEPSAQYGRCRKCNAALRTRHQAWCGNCGGQLFGAANVEPKILAIWWVMALTAAITAMQYLAGHLWMMR